MPNKRKRTYNGYSRPYKKRRVRRATFSRQQKAELGIEMKFRDSFLVNGTLVTTVDGAGGEQNESAIKTISTITAGDLENQRDGRKATFKSVFINGVVNCASQISQTTVDEGTTIFFALVLDSQTNGIIINSEDVYINPSGSDANSCQLLRNMANIERFTILATRTFSVVSSSGVFDGTDIEINGDNHAFTIYYRFKKPVIANFSTNTGVISSCKDNSIQVLCWASSTSRAPKLSYNARLRFIG